MINAKDYEVVEADTLRELLQFQVGKTVKRYEDDFEGIGGVAPDEIAGVVFTDGTAIVIETTGAKHYSENTWTDGSVDYYLLTPRKRAS